MSERERPIAIAVGAIVGLLVLFFGYRMISGGFTAKKERLYTARQSRDDNTRELKRAESDRALVDRFRGKTLTGDLENAQLDFQAWLELQVKQAGLDKTSFTFQGIPRSKRTKKELVYLVQGTGDIKQITEFLYRVQSADTLHRIGTLDLQKKKDGIQMTARIDAVSMPDVAGQGKVAVGTLNESKMSKTLDQYQDSLSMRNMFSPANEAPRFSSLRTQTAELGSSWSYRVEATDPDEHELVFELDDDAPEWLEISKSGRLKGRPKEEGRFKFKIYCMDRGIPSKETVGELTVKVVQPEEEEEEEEQEKFDTSKLAFVTSIRQGPRDPKPHMCLHLRDKDEMKYLGEGDELKVGKWEGKVTEVDVDTNTVVLETEDEEYELRIGYPLSEARRIERVPAKVPQDNDDLKGV